MSACYKDNFTLLVIIQKAREGRDCAEAITTEESFQGN